MENLARKSLSIVEQREAIKTLLKVLSTKDPSKFADQETNKRYGEVARKIGCSTAWISQIMEVEKAQPEII